MTRALARLAALLIAVPSALHAADFSFAAPAGPQFTDEQKQAQRDAGVRVGPMVLEAVRAGAGSVRVPPGDYRFGKERWDRDGVVHPLEFADLRREEADAFTIDATGATFWFDLPDDLAPTCHFCIGFRNCRNITFRGATIDRATRGHVEGRNTQIDVAIGLHTHLAPPFGRIAVVGNTFNRPRDLAVALPGVSGLVLAGNTFGRTK